MDRKEEGFLRTSSERIGKNGGVSKFTPKYRWALLLSYLLYLALFSIFHGG